jgi:transcriptional regulator with XRE-family HTH domain
MSNANIAEKIAASRRLLSAARRADTAFLFKSQMIEQNLKNTDIAARLGVSPANVSRWLRGDQNLSLDTLHALADALQRSLVVQCRPVDERSHTEDEEWTPDPSLVKGVIEHCAYRHLRKTALSAREKPFASPTSEVVRESNKENDEPVAVG